MKYIVYLTTNIKNSKIYVGVHGTQNPDKFDGYLGNGVNRYNASTIENGSTPFVKAVKKYGFDSFRRSILYIFDTMEEALYMESIIVDEEFIKRDDTYNITLGGGLPPRNDKKTYQYNLDGTFVKEWNSRLDAARAFSQADLIISTSTIYNAITYKRKSYGYLWADYKTDKLPVEEYNNKITNTVVHLYDLNGTYIKTFNSISECADCIGSAFERVRQALILKRTLQSKYQVSDILYDKLPKQNPIKISGDIHRYDLDGNYIDSFSSVKEVKNKLNISLTNINECIQLTGYQKGFLWRRGYKEDKIPPYKVPSKKVGQYTMDGTLVKVFNTVREARKEFPNVSKVLSGVSKHCHNFTFKYLS